MNLRSTLVVGFATLLLTALPASAQKKYYIGATDTDIKI